MKQIQKNKYIDALKKLILFSAISHIILLILYSIINLTIIPLNYFNILDLDLFFPNIINGHLSQILSLIIIAIIYWTIYFFSSKKLNK
jgi:hypothetical protein